MRTSTNPATLYRQFRAAGYPSLESWESAKIAEEFYLHSKEDESPDEVGAVRLRVEPEYESYFDVYGEPWGFTDISGRYISAEEARHQIEESIQLNGLYCVISDVWNGDEWEPVDSIGMCVCSDPESPIENWYIPDLMRAALERREELLHDNLVALHGDLSLIP